MLKTNVIFEFCVWSFSWAKKSGSIFYLLAFLFICNFSWAAANDNWHIIKSTHFIVYYKNASNRFIERLIDTAEDCYGKIADDLGFRRQDFWLKDKRAKIYIYDNSEDYQTATSQPAWSSGCAVGREKEIHSFPYASAFFDRVLPHEMGHIIFREFVGVDNSAVPLWLDEGVASYQENAKRSSSNILVIKAIKAGSVIGLEKLNSLNPEQILDRQVVETFYAEAVSVVCYLIKQFGEDNFVYFCRRLRDTRDLNKALNYTYSLKNIRELEQAWQRYLER